VEKRATKRPSIDQQPTNVSPPKGYHRGREGGGGEGKSEVEAVSHGKTNVEERKKEEKEGRPREGNNSSRPP